MENWGAKFFTTAALYYWDIANHLYKLNFCDQLCTKIYVQLFLVLLSKHGIFPWCWFLFGYCLRTNFSVFSLNALGLQPYCCNGNVVETKKLLAGIEMRTFQSTDLSYSKFNWQLQMQFLYYPLLGSFSQGDVSLKISICFSFNDMLSEPHFS